MKTEEEKAKLALLEALEEKEKYLKFHKMETFFPDGGPFSRHLYPKHMEFMAAGKNYLQRAIIAANRTGKTIMGAYEMTCHLTGEYPHWWQGRKFKSPIHAWAASVNNESTKNILQYELLGDPAVPGSGMIPRDKLFRDQAGRLKMIKKPGVADAIETVYVKHKSGGTSRLDFKSYEQGREAFQGTKRQVIWLDEEPRDYGIYSECLTRTMDKYEPGMIYCTFTPLFGLSDVVLSFMPEGRMPEGGVHPDNPHKFVSQVSWEEVPHLNEEQKGEILASYSKHEREARSKGIPSLGAGAIYPFLEDDFVVEPFKIPVWWPRVYGLDVGWNKTAAIWLAQDPDTNIIYVYSEHYMSESPPALNASAIKQRGEWMIGVIDPASRGKSQIDGRTLFDLYEQEGLDLELANNAVEAGILKVYQAFEVGQIKIFSSCVNTLNEIRIYRRNENGEIIKKKDHLMDALRYAMVSGLDFLQLPHSDDFYMPSDVSQGTKDEFTGY